MHGACVGIIDETLHTGTDPDRQQRAGDIAFPEITPLGFFARFCRQWIEPPASRTVYFWRRKHMKINQRFSPILFYGNLTYPGVLAVRRLPTIYALSFTASALPPKTRVSV